jgi:hypothetical protein
LLTKGYAWHACKWSVDDGEHEGWKRDLLYCQQPN